MPKASILVIVNEPNFRASIVFALEAEDFETAVPDPASNGPETQQALASHCVVIDHRPPRLDAVAMAEHLRIAGVAAPVLILSTANSPRLRQRIEAVGAELIEKPLLGDTLIAAVRRNTGTGEAGRRANKGAVPPS